MKYARYFCGNHDGVVISDEDYRAFGENEAQNNDAINYEPIFDGHIYPTLAESSAAQIAAFGYHYNDDRRKPPDIKTEGEKIMNTSHKIFEDVLVDMISNDTVVNIEDFLGYPISADVMENLDDRIREVLLQMPDDVVFTFVQNYLSMIPTETLQKMSEEAFSAYYREATKQVDYQPGMKFPELEAATNRLNAINDEIERRMAENVKNMDIEQLDLSVRAWKILKNAGINTTDDLVKYSEKDLSKLEHMGWVPLGEIKNKMAEFGLELRKESNLDERIKSAKDRVDCSNTHNMYKDIPTK